MEKNKLPKGLKQVHIGEDVWYVGRISNKFNKDNNCYERHCVIYGPDRKNYHVYGKDVDLLLENYELNRNDYMRNGSYINNDGNYTIEYAVKIYILTHILDERKNWCFDLKSKYDKKDIKIIYNNGTIKNLKDFNGTFGPVSIKNYSYKFTKVNLTDKIIHPVAYRLS